MLVKFVGVFPIYGGKHTIFLLKSINKVNDINKFFTLNYLYIPGIKLSHGELFSECDIRIRYYVDIDSYMDINSLFRIFALIFIFIIFSLCAICTDLDISVILMLILLKKDLQVFFHLL